MQQALDQSRLVGVALAAPQVGIFKRIVLVDFKHMVPVDEPNPCHMVFFNPKIIGAGEQIQVGQEGCLSLPRLTADVERPYGIIVQYFDQEGKMHQQRAEGFLARVLCHEIDHLDGVLFIDRTTRQQKRRILREVEKIRRYDSLWQSN